MTDDAEPEPIGWLYDQLQDRLRARDKEGAIEAYYQLFVAGRPLGEVIAKGALDRVGNSGSELQNPIQTAPVAQAASALGGLAVADDTQTSDPDLFEPGSDITSEVRSVGVARGADFYAQWWFVWRKPWVIGALIGIGALVVPITLVHDTSLEKVVASIERAADTVTFAITSTSAAPATSAATFAGLTESLKMTPSSKPADSSGPATGASGEAIPDPPFSANASPKVVVAATPTREDGPDQPGRAAPSKPADASGQATGASGEAVPDPSVGGDGPPKAVLAAKTERGKPSPSGTETKALVSRGDALFGIGDLTAARLFYQRGTDLGDGTAALRLGETFDPAFLKQAGLGRVAGDLNRALYWYRRAQDLDNRDAYLLTKGLSSPGSNPR